MRLGQQLAFSTGLAHCQSHQARGTLPRSGFPYGSQLFSGMFVLEMDWVDWVYLQKFQQLIVAGKARNPLFGSTPLDFGVIVLRVNFWRHRPPSSLAGFCSTQPDGKCYLCLCTLVTRTFRFGAISFLHVACCCMPTCLKSAVLSPLLKKPDADFLQFKNFRHISNLKALSKIIEKSVALQLNNYLMNNNLHENFQSAYKVHHSTETVVVKVQDDILHAIDGNKAVVLLMLDLSAAFDTNNCVS